MALSNQSDLLAFLSPESQLKNSYQFRLWTIRSHSSPEDDCWFHQIHNWDNCKKPFPKCRINWSFLLGGGEAILQVLNLVRTRV